MPGDLVSNAPKPTPAVRRILVAVDADDHSQWAVAFGSHLARDLAARLALVSVAEPAMPRDTDAGVIEPGLVPTGPTPEEILGRAQFHCPDAIGAERIVRFGIPAEQIVIAAEKWRADLIVMGTHARGRLGRFLLGSTAHAVVRRANCPVVTIGHDPALGQHTTAEPSVKAAIRPDSERLS